MIWREKYPNHFKNWVVKTKVLDAERYIKHKDATFFFQFALNDEHILIEEAYEYLELSPEPYHVKFYDSDHA